MTMMMKFYTFTFLIFLFSMLQGHCKSDINLGHSLTLTSPLEYAPGLMGKAYIMETESSSSTREPGFKAALTMGSSDKDDGKYLCSLQVFLGDVRVWSSGHYSKMYVSSKCIIELTKDGDLRLKSSNKHVGWRSGTSGQGVERLEIQSTGNLVLHDAKNLIKWQSFNFPTDVMLSGQRLDVATQLTSFPNDSTLFYSFEVLRDKIALFLNLNNLKYSYWEYKPRDRNKTVNFVRLGPKGLDLFDDNSHIIGRIEQPLSRFLALGNKTGNLGLYSYKPEKGKFEATFQAVSDTCDLPVSCKPYGICTFSKSCSCIKAVSNGDCSSNVEEAVSVKRLCDHEMVELEGVTTVLRNGTQVRNVRKERCEELCKKDCECAAASYSVSDESCVMYGIVMGVKQIERVSGLSYMVKVPKGVRLSGEKPNVKKWVVGLVGGIDGFVILLLLSGLVFYFIRKRQKSSSPRLPPQQPPNTDS
ncbi:PREDICTED: G-type lectin S-receptor-like serine/threonine-protein kinase At5g24080 [Camelina sativa]|uniref:G-type lectin S-receptor-like serine/threonine-protein kinase At5g24080 n=1 Tax=Camelina sativa TaxID=90675 RepID=A0ABM0YP47_CAMSA|nr:PREDICTED: G-type lectin S-receptor-like serine/threonine-protein kinase At5g24080 [Camelina sativa]